MKKTAITSIHSVTFTSYILKIFDELIVDKDSQEVGFAVLKFSEQFFVI